METTPLTLAQRRRAARALTSPADIIAAHQALRQHAAALAACEACYGTGDLPRWQVQLLDCEHAGRWARVTRPGIGTGWDIFLMEENNDVS